MANGDNDMIHHGDDNHNNGILPSICTTQQGTRLIRASAQHLTGHHSAHSVQQRPKLAHVDENHHTCVRRKEHLLPKSGQWPSCSVPNNRQMGVSHAYVDADALCAHLAIQEINEYIANAKYQTTMDVPMWLSHLSPRSLATPTCKHLWSCFSSPLWHYARCHTMSYDYACPARDFDTVLTMTHKEVQGVQM